MKVSGLIGFVLLVMLLCTSLGTLAEEANGDLWLRLDFENELAPNAGSFKDSVTPHFARKSEACTPEGCMVGIDIPRFVDGHRGQGLYIGGKVRNLLKADIADIAFADNKLNGINILADAEVKQVKSNDSFTGVTCLEVSTPKVLNSGISIPLSVSGNGLYIFSFYLKGKGLFRLSAKFEDNADANMTDKPVKINATSEWKRHFIWFYAKESAKVLINIKNAMGKRMNFSMDTLQLEKQKKLRANFESKQFPYGTGFSPGPWISGRKKSLGDQFKLVWSRDKVKSFPYKEGTISLWIKPEFNPNDCRNHEIFSRYYMKFSLAKRSYSNLIFMRGKNEADNKKKNPHSWMIMNCSKAPAFKRGAWSQMTVTWSNKAQKIAFYLNGALLKEDRSLLLEGFKGAYFVIGSHEKSGYLNGTLDEISIYAKAFSSEEVKACYEKEKGK